MSEPQRLEAAIERAPYDAGNYAVYGDWLEERGDPRGQLIALQIAAEHDPRLAGTARALFEAQRARFLGTLPDVFAWRAGFIRRATFAMEERQHVAAATHAWLGALLDHPSARFLVELDVGFAYDLKHAIDMIAAAPRPALRYLALGSADAEALSRARQVEVGSLELLWSAVPRLEQLAVCGRDLDLSGIDLPQLIGLELVTTSLSLPAGRAIAHAHWPELERLSVWYGPQHSSHAATLELQHLLHHAHVPRLAHLELLGVDFFDHLLTEHFLTSPVVRQLRSLSLAHGALLDRNAALLAEHAGALAHLDLLDVSHNGLTVLGTRAVSRLAKTVVTGDQVDPDDRDPDLYDY